MQVGVVSTGRMGTTLGKLCQDNGHEVLWASEGRSERSRRNAELFSFTDVGSPAALLERSDVVFCVVSGDGNAIDFADFAQQHNFTGIYVDANSLYDESSDKCLYQRVGEMKFVDMALRGWTVFDDQCARPEMAKMFLDGEDAGLVASLVKNSSWAVRLHPVLSPKQIIRLYRDGDLDDATYELKYGKLMSDG